MSGPQHFYALLDETYVVGGTTDGTTETVFHNDGGTTESGGLVNIYADSANKFDFFLCHAVVEATNTNSTDTLRIRAYYGPTADITTGILIADQTAIDVADNDEIALSFFVAVETAGAASTARFSAGGLSWADAVTSVSLTNAKTQVDAQVSTIADMAIGLTATWSVSNAGNEATLRSLHVIKFPASASS